ERQLALDIRDYRRGITVFQCVRVSCAALPEGPSVESTRSDAVRASVRGRSNDCSRLIRFIDSWCRAEIPPVARLSKMTGMIPTKCPCLVFFPEQSDVS